MKMVKKILLGMALTAAVISFVSCGVKQDEGKAFNGENIDYSNTEKDDDGNFKYKYYRSFDSTSTKHNSANATITIDNAADVADVTLSDGSKVKAKAGFGFVFGMKEVTDKDNPVKKTVTDKDGKSKEVTVKFYDFGVAAVRYNKSSKKIEWYVDWERNVPDTAFNNTNLATFEDTALTEAPKQVEKEAVVAWTAVNGFELKDGKLVAMIKTVANDDGSYTVTLCDEEGTQIAGSATAEVKKDWTGLTEKTQLYIGRYITVYQGQTVTGKIEYSDISGNVIPADYALVIE